MPFNRPTLTELRERNKAFVESELQDIGALLRFSNLRVLSDADAGMAWLHYGYLDWIAKQAVPYTATDEYLAAWGALKAIYRKAAVAATCSSVVFTGSKGSTVTAGAILNRSDGYQYTLDKAITLGSDGTAGGSITAVLLDPEEDATTGGDKGNADAGTLLSLDISWLGIDSTVTLNTAATGGTDIEDEEVFRSRVLYAYQNAPQGGSDADYKKWALAVSGVTRAWVKRRLSGAGTVGVYIMCDENNNEGFPVGTDGISPLEDWGAINATGDQLTVADYIYPRQTDTAIVFVCAPVKRIIDFEISGLTSADSTTVQAIKDALTDVFFDNANPDGTGKVYLSDINQSIGDVTGTAGYILNAPTANIVLGVGEIPVLGQVDFI
ncbi:baseplate J/gp47 family protein [Symbiopectobacterium purcellii]|uniref:Baseplate J/gp47 family protein n=1 Tax=Symbiopectobacterium purcellii TaxID=2871826 RepID=A0ABX9AQU1_9ENTR|nr:baseplate J/gp47 family protein [Symbiopectobacterium purcellii]QZN97362.1 baseplate J/gp47 family protein [Symbiopectobacterium purcellii]